MKLKLDKSDDITILSVSEQVSLNDTAVLKAGLGKIFQSGRISVLLDLTALKGPDLMDSAAVAELMGLEAWAKSKGGFLTLVGTANAIASACKAGTRDEGIKVFTNSVDHLQALHHKLSQQLKSIESTRDALMQRIKAAGSISDQIRNLRLENGELRAQISELEQIVGEQFEGWAEPLPGALSDKAETAMKIMESILKQEGIIT